VDSKGQITENSCFLDIMMPVKGRKDVKCLLEFEELKIRLNASKEQINELRDSL